MKFVLILLIFSALVYCQFENAVNCKDRMTPSKNSCVKYETNDCALGEIHWPYPMDTCKFIFTYFRKDFRHVNVTVQFLEPLQWKVTDLKGELIQKGSGELQNTFDLQQSAFILDLTYPSTINAYVIFLKWAFF